MIIKHTKYQGIKMCSNMRWIEHKNQVSNKVRKMFYVFRKLRSILYKRELRIVCKTITEPITPYGIIDWGGGLMNTF
jgi:hypothetical protein